MKDWRKNTLTYYEKFRPEFLLVKISEEYLFNLRNGGYMFF